MNKNLTTINKSPFFDWDRAFGGLQRWADENVSEADVHSQQECRCVLEKMWNK